LIFLQSETAASIKLLMREYTTSQLLVATWSS
jgi:hypothetical protein